MSKHVYLGPYVECTYKPATRTAHVYGCTSTSCENHKKIAPARNKFCSACGAPNGQLSIEVAVRLDHYAVVGDALFDMNPRTDALWLAPKVRREGYPRPHLDDDGEFCLDLRDVDREAEIAWLERAFAPELTKLREAYATVEIRWGLCQYFM